MACAVQVLQANAVETTYRIANDGYVEKEFDLVVPCGAVSAGEDASVHAISNPSTNEGVLVTLHVYAPPLRKFQRFVARPVSRSSIDS